MNNKEWFHLPPGETWKLLTDECYGLSLIGAAKIHAFVMMSNHYHMIVSSPVVPIDEVMKYFSEFVTRSYNLKSGRTGHLFSGRYKWSLIQSSLYYAHALKYVYRNPIKAGLSERAEDYPYSVLHGLFGNSHLPFPVAKLEDDVFGRSRIPEDSETFLAWLNTPFRGEDSEMIRKALRRKVFELPKNRKDRAASHLENELA